MDNYFAGNWLRGAVLLAILLSASEMHRYTFSARPGLRALQNMKVGNQCKELYFISTFGDRNCARISRTIVFSWTTRCQPRVVLVALAEGRATDTSRRAAANQITNLFQGCLFWGRA
jgi:hypothetical protein